MRGQGKSQARLGIVYDAKRGTGCTPITYWAWFGLTVGFSTQAGCPCYPARKGQPIAHLENGNKAVVDVVEVGADDVRPAHLQVQTGMGR